MNHRTPLKHNAGATSIHLLLTAVIALAALHHPAAAQDTQSGLDDQTIKALHKSLDDERKAQAVYQAVMNRHGQVLPFRHIIRAEQRHEARLLELYKRYGVQVPDNAYVAAAWDPDAQKATAPTPDEKGKTVIESPETLELAYKQGVAAEIENIKMYDGFLEFVTEPDIQRVFSALRRASQENHLRAFQRFASGEGCKQGCGKKGKGCGKGACQPKANGKRSGQGEAKGKAKGKQKGKGCGGCQGGCGKQAGRGKDAS